MKSVFWRIEERSSHGTIFGSNEKLSSHIRRVVREACQSVVYFMQDADGEMTYFWVVTIPQLKSLVALLDETKPRLPNKDFINLKVNLLYRLMFVPQYERLALMGTESPRCLDNMIRALADLKPFQGFKYLPDINGDYIFFGFPQGGDGYNEIALQSSPICRCHRSQSIDGPQSVMLSDIESNMISKPLFR